MIFSFKKYCTFEFAITGLLTIILTGCGGGGSEGSNTQGNSNSSIPTALPSSTPVVVASSVPISSSAPSSSSLAISVTTSSSAPSSTPIQATKSSSPTQSSYARSSRASSSLADMDDDVIYPEEPEEFFDLPPTAPRNVKLEVISSNTAIISWSPATDDVALSRYEIRRDGVAIGTSVASNLEYEDTGLNHNTYYTYTVRAIDTSGNRSNFSTALIVKTTSINTHNTSSNSSTTTSSVSSINNTSSSVSETSSTNSTSNSSVALSSSEATSSSTASISASSEANASNSSTSAETSSSATAISSSSEANASSSSSDNLVSVEWITPSQRENGDYLELDEIGGYELRYKPINSSVYIREIITDKYATSYETTNASTDGLFQIAAFDTNGLYSRFITLSPR
ncbi:hypothetical protein O59_000746 [Cellvibrio sp. BR]|uniref:fibronectin type III domain-containing protein n=1 Tax=Cellvibrio sp. BR TaxID=1134474 RepID=UPI0002601379|nr:fibronectin type III domain-containing protein [Cellvibrio sp. BR]EIK46725.1 hypothetical protein O59_000746 [Cellvibrio sp. BR]